MPSEPPWLRARRSSKHVLQCRQERGRFPDALAELMAEPPWSLGGWAGETPAVPGGWLLNPRAEPGPLFCGRTKDNKGQGHQGHRGTVPLLCLKSLPSLDGGLPYRTGGLPNWSCGPARLFPVLQSLRQLLLSTAQVLEYSSTVLVYSP